MYASVTLTAPAKINLSLRITGRRPDGFHLLEGLTGFTAFGDNLTLSPAGEGVFVLNVTGRFAEDCPADDGNLIAKAFNALQARFPARKIGGVDVRLTKNLPVASGIGGGSSDAAAFLLGYNRLYDNPFPFETLTAIARDLGADIPMCLYRKPCRIGGIGDEIYPVKAVGPFYGLLINPLIPLSTPAVFKAFKESGAGFSSFSANDAYKEIKEGKNDLTPHAIRLVPKIREILEFLQSFNPVKADMSGSGATCFALYASRAAAEKSCAAARKEFPDFFIRDTLVFV